MIGLVANKNIILETMAMRDSNERRWRQQIGNDDCSGIGQRRLAANTTDGDGGGWRGRWRQRPTTMAGKSGQGRVRDETGRGTKTAFSVY